MEETMSDEEYEREISRTILKQMGGQARLKIMTGCSIEIGQACVDITVPRPAKDYCKRVHISYNEGLDLYDVTGYTVRGRVLQEHKEVYAEDLVSLFEKMTGYFLGNVYVVGI